MSLQEFGTFLLAETMRGRANPIEHIYYISLTLSYCLKLRERKPITVSLRESDTLSLAETMRRRTNPSKPILEFDTFLLAETMSDATNPSEPIIV